VWVKFIGTHAEYDKINVEELLRPSNLSRPRLTFRARLLAWKSRARASEVLNGKRQLTLPMIRRLALSLDINAEVLVGVGHSRERAVGE
jgi:plasmid maintenance system antidote protein VapI